MASSSSTGDKPAIKNKRKRLVQPVLPALPHIPASKKKSGVITQQSAPAVNGVEDGPSETSSRRVSIKETPILPNGVHKDGSPEAGDVTTATEDNNAPAIDTTASRDGRPQSYNAKPLLIMELSFYTS